jgi:hypothetical protein
MASSANSHIITSALCTTWTVNLVAVGNDENLQLTETLGYGAYKAVIA